MINKVYFKNNIKTIIMKNKKINSFFNFIYYAKKTYISFFFNKNKFKLTNKKINFFINKLSFYFFFKINFKGKGYKIIKNIQNKLTFLFNKSHLNNFYYKKIIIKKIKKNKIILISTYINLLKKSINKILKIQYVSIFTKRGLKLSKQINYKKQGKKSQK